MNLVEKDKKYIWHPFTPQKNMAAPVAIVKGKETLLYDENGHAYIDAISSWWVTLHGHAHPYIAEKLYQQALTLEQVIFAGFTHEPAVTLAEKLLPLLPGSFARIFYSDNGSTSTEVALKMSLQYWWNQQQPQRKKILAFRNSYHGDTFGAMSVSDRGVFTMAFHDLLFEVIFIDTPTSNNLPATLAILQQQHPHIAAFIYEPLVQGAGGMQFYEASAMNQLLQAVQQYGIICIADEVMTGFGRTGKLFASEYLTYQPDIICLSKGLTGGTMALGVTACVQRIYDAFVQDDKLKTFFHGHSFTANPLACTTAVASLELLEKENSMAKVEWISNRNKLFASTLLAFAQVKNIRTLGTILAFEVDKGKDEYLNNISHTITQQCMQAGVYLRPLGNTVYIMPPYCITSAQLDKVYTTLLEVINAVTE
ncbi:adenosylmethionine-8-amino-7-oxononanoate aminotransferase [Filimonas lacunae]|uniref:Adenosylmethionine-8-amino-7-oxononanoate aminotransferase n=1 Tax=Filimonas lacunae TaxID=477680 RepID=A0A173ME01_9BACT|nr:adenosylmethionine--8-amino-7-oxononanoate transaminase [Filimonas lacunae]BAV05814.1 adenosylmethionine-8-amino-7-oxononanoate aminotransferase [Filimonas lacunae]SIT28520.1 adenosylmethionine-8-amino-7-oxononanoate aminotransferase [Filimonas lacunae]